MPLESYARRFAVDVTGRTRWGSNGPGGYSSRAPMELLLDAMFKGQEMLSSELIIIDDKPMKKAVGLDPERRFFSASELAQTTALNALLMGFEQRRAADPQAKPSRDERKALDARSAANRLADLAGGAPLAMIPGAPGGEFARVGPLVADPGAEGAQQAWKQIGEAYASGQPMMPGVDALERAVASLGTLPADDARAVKFELFYDRYNPWSKTAMLYGLAIVLFGFSRLALRRPLMLAAAACTGLAVLIHALGIGLRVVILGRAPVTNTFESLIWMGLVGMILGLIAQAASKNKGMYAFAGVCAAFVSVLFAGLVPLTDRSNSLPAVLRSNFWLIIHVLTIVASYGVLAVSAVLGHIHLIKATLLRKNDDHSTLVVQTYRTIQVGLLLLTAGTILGGVWAAESWGRFWGWDPKETWALIAILTYFAVLHARYVGWLKDFGLAASAILGLVVIVWTFYGVNYVMATGLHSYGFGSGGEMWVGLWALIEIAFVSVCWMRQRTFTSVVAGPGAAATHEVKPATH